MSSRYAIYLAPPPDSPLWRFGSRALGRDAATGESLEGFAPDGDSPQAWAAVAEEPRRYGFHATLKAPFRLREGRTRAELVAALAALAKDVRAFDLGPLRVSTLRPEGGDVGFVALTPAAPSPDLTSLEARVLRDLDPFRAPPTEADIARRRPDLLSPRQRDHLDAWGYPYVLEEFRLHFTLSGAVAAPEALAAKLALEFARAAPDPGFRVDALVLFEQADGAPFRIAERFPLLQAP